MLKIERMWKCGRGDTYFNDTFCVCVCVWRSRTVPNWVLSGSLYGLLYTYVRNLRYVRKFNDVQREMYM